MSDPVEVFGSEDGWLCVRDTGGVEFYLVPAHLPLSASAGDVVWVKLGDFRLLEEQETVHGD